MQKGGIIVMKKIKNTKFYKEGFFVEPLSRIDSEVFELIEKEELRQKGSIELIAPKNYMSFAARQALGSIFSFTSVEGYPGKRYHAGLVNLDVIETLAIERAKELFQCSYANVQPHSGTQANQAVLFAFLNPGDKILSMSLKDGGHLSHGLKSNFSGKWFEVINYGVHKDDGLINYEEAEYLCLKHKPRLIIVGGSSYPRIIDFDRFRKMANEVDAYLMADVAHFSGLIAGGFYPNPFPYSHVVTLTTNKNLRGPRGGLILSNESNLEKSLNSSVFPGIQGGPLPEIITAKAVALGEALTLKFKDYAKEVLANARTLSHILQERGYDIVTGGTDTPLVIVDLRKQGITGARASHVLETIGISCNKNLVPGDSTSPAVTSGLRFGTSAITTRGLRSEEVIDIATLIADVLDQISDSLESTPFFNEACRKIERIAAEFPIYPH
jgi:glycine hydroxymethyltransferase